jgi:pyruvate/2-oxoglutarate dehydrogenase complex dihydrolipoamide acyltransferase (E2) component
VDTDLLGRFEELPYPLARMATVDTVRVGLAKHHIPALLEVDVTAARAAIAQAKRAGRDVSFTGWAVWCVARAAAEHKRVHALRKGRRSLVVFDDVDVALAVFRQVKDDAAGERIPMPFVVRRANERSVEQIAAALRGAQTRPLAPGEQWLDPSGFAPPPRLVRLAFGVPFRLRKWLYWDRLLGDPFRVKRTMGTVMVTSVPLATKSGGGAWAIPVGIHPLIVALGAIGRRAPAAADDAALGAREVLSLTVLFDHDVTDGVPVARFLRMLVDLMETAAGL